MKLICSVLFVCAAAQAFDIDWNNVFHMEAYPYMPHRLVPLPKFEGKVVGGQEATPHQFPHQVALFVQLPQGVAFCGGSLISDEWVMTAAHCAVDASNFTVFLGAHNIRQEEPGRIELETSQKIVHPKYNSLDISNDIAFLKLPQKVTLNENVQTIRLPSKSQQDETFTGQNSLVSGWGKDKDSSTSVSPVLRYVENPIITNDDCIKGMLGLGPIKDTNICQSGKGGKSACNGDSGGPLKVTDEDGKDTVVGIVSFGLIFGCELGIPGAYTRVTSYLDFIEESTGIEIRP